MTKREQIEYLKKYKEAIIYMTGYETEEEKNKKELINKEPQKVKVLKRKIRGREIVIR